MTSTKWRGPLRSPQLLNGRGSTRERETSLYLTLTNRGRVTSIEVNDESSSDAPWEVYAAKVELELENARTAAQDVPSA